MTYNVDENGILLKPGFHDGYLVGLTLEGDTLDIRLRNSRDEVFRMHLSGLNRLVSHDFREGNIINTVWVLRRVRPDARFVRALFGDLHPSVSSPYRERHEQAVEACARDVAEGKSTLVVVEPSYGCELHALCEGVQIEPA